MKFPIFQTNTSNGRLFLLSVLFLACFVCFSRGTNSAFGADQKAALKWGPVMGLITAGNADIKWATSVPVKCSVICNGQSVSNVKSADIFHEIFLEKLAPDTSYEYYISLESPQGVNKCGPFSFKTPPEKLTNWSFLVYGDTRGNNQDPNLSTNNVDHEKVIKAMGKVSPTPWFCIDTGDLVDRGERYDNWDKFFQIVNPLLQKIPFLPVRGNHDVSSTIFSSIFYSPLTEGNQKINWYSFRFGNAQFVLLDTGWEDKNDVSVCMAKLKNQIPFLEKVLDQANKDEIAWKFVVVHIPPFCSGRYGCNNDLIANLVPIFEKYKVTCCFSAHCHLYERSFKNGVIYVVSGGGGAPFQEPPGTKPNSNSVYGLQSHHYLTVDVSPESVNIKAFSPNGEIIDSFNQNTGGLVGNPCWNPAQPTIKDTVTIASTRPAKLHWGINGWTMPPENVWPAGSEKWSDGKAIESPMTPGEGGKEFLTKIGPFQNLQPTVQEINCVFHYSDNTWGKDFKIPVK